MIKNITLFAVLIVATVLSACAPCRAFWFGPKTDSLWAVRPLQPDGNAQKWQVREGDEDSGLAYAFANDLKNIYLMLSPHTKSAKDELAGSYGQDFTIWLDTHAGKGKIIGIRLAAPAGQRDQSARTTEVIGLDTAAVPVSLDNDGAEISIAPVLERGIIEARIPLRYLGTGPVNKISIGIETSQPKEAPPRAEKKSGSWQKEQTAGGEDAGGMAGGGVKRGHRGGGGLQRSKVPQDEDLTPLDIWIRVTLAPQPKTAGQ